MTMKQENIQVSFDEEKNMPRDIYDPRLYLTDSDFYWDKLVPFIKDLQPFLSRFFMTVCKTEGILSGEGNINVLLKSISLLPTPIFENFIHILQVMRPIALKVQAEEQKQESINNFERRNLAGKYLRLVRVLHDFVATTEELDDHEKKTFQIFISKAMYTSAKLLDVQPDALKMMKKEIEEQEASHDPTA